MSKMIEICGMYIVIEKICMVGTFYELQGNQIGFAVHTPGGNTLLSFESKPEAVEARDKLFQAIEDNEKS